MLNLPLHALKIQIFLIQIDDELIKKVVSSKREMNARVYDVLTSAILIDSKRANYHKVITSFIDMYLKHFLNY